MGAGATLSILGLYQWDNTLFDTMYFPVGFTQEDKEITIKNIIMEGAGLEVIYPNWDFMRDAIYAWSRKEKLVWDRIYAASKLEYNPIENYDRQELSTVTSEGTDAHRGTDTSSGSSTSTIENSGADVSANDVTGYDSGNMVPHDKNTFTHGGKSDTTGSASQTFTHGEAIDKDMETVTNSRIHGNIGVTTSQQMLEQEMEIAVKLNLIDKIVKSFINRFCLLVY